MAWLTARDGARLYYRDQGSGRTLVLLHGWAAHGGYFDHLAGTLAPRFRVVVPDLRGHGRSWPVATPPDLALLGQDLDDLIAGLGLRDAVVLGWSMGAFVAFERIRARGLAGIGALAVVDMTARLVNDAQWRLGLRGAVDLAQALAAAREMRRDWRGYVGRVAHNLFAEGRPEPAVLGGWVRAEMAAQDGAVLSGLWAGLSRADYRPVLSAIGRPVLVMCGGRSRLYGPQVGAWMESVLPDATRLVFDRAGHAPHLEQPARFAAAISAYAQKG